MRFGIVDSVLACHFRILVLRKTVLKSKFGFSKWEQGERESGKLASSEKWQLARNFRSLRNLYLTRLCWPNPASGGLGFRLGIWGNG
jgi:hypothetical protein